MAHQLKAESDQNLGSWPNAINIRELRIHQFSMTDFNPRRQTAEIAITVQDPREHFQHPIFDESAENLPLMRQILELVFPDGETVEQKLLERVCQCRDPQTKKRLFPAFTVQKVPKEKS